MTLSELMPFEEALQSLARRKVLPTDLSSAQLQQLGAGFHRANFTSARTLVEDLLQAYKDKVQQIINPHTVIDAQTGQPKTQGLDIPTARLEIKQLQRALGFDATDGSGPITDLTSNARINLVLRTNRDVMLGAGQFIQSNTGTALDTFPCQELVRIEDRKEKRDWPTRFRICAEVVGDVDAFRVLGETGRMIARKDSAIWQALGDGQDGSTDTLGNPFPPFAFSSGMGLRDVSRSESLDLGLIQPGSIVQSKLPADLAEIFSFTA